MKKGLILHRLDATIAMIERLRDDEFMYKEHVFEHKDGCGTVCCVAGWYPKYFPEAGLELFEVVGRCDIRSVGTMSPWHTLAKYHGLSDEVIDCLFYGQEYTGLDGTIYFAESGMSSTRTQVLDLFKKIRAGVEAETVI